MVATSVRPAVRGTVATATMNMALMAMARVGMVVAVVRGRAAERVEWLPKSARSDDGRAINVARWRVGELREWGAPEGAP